MHPAHHSSRTPSASKKLPPIEEVQPLARSLAQRIAHRPEDIDDLVQVALFAYHRDQQRRRKAGVRNAWALVHTILRRAMIGFYYYAYPKRGRFLHLNSQEYKRYRPVELCDTVTSVGEAQDELFDLDDYYRALESECGSTARTLVENLIAPSNPCIVGFILADSREKLDKRSKSRSRTVAGRRRLPRGGGAHHPIRITQTLIGKAMGLAPWELSRELTRIREFTRGWLTRNGSIRARSLTA